MQNHSYIYFFNYDYNESELCKLESRHIFHQEEKDKLLFSSVKINPSHSAFIKKRLDIITSSEDYSTLIKNIKMVRICVEGFKVEYIVLPDDTTSYPDRLSKLKDIGYSIEGNPDYYHPNVTYAICFHAGIWYFGLLTKNSFDWHKHKHKPCSFSNSISTSVAKSLVNIASNGNKETKILDVCCGVGTIMLEACFAGYHIDGCDINEKICEHARINLQHFHYKAEVHHSDIKDISERYDAAIIDLPYNIFSSTNDNKLLDIIESTSKITNRLVIVSISDISGLINAAGLSLFDYCATEKTKKAKFTRKIWVCKKNDQAKT